MGLVNWFHQLGKAKAKCRRRHHRFAHAGLEEELESSSLLHTSPLHTCRTSEFSTALETGGPRGTAYRARFAGMALLATGTTRSGRAPSTRNCSCSNASTSHEEEHEVSGV